ncbi:hypothetical protein HaLaN_19208 [Haematococcus lacustris]|uniref:Uncharacterized protein n=1 Tax=Haematococcus lacustris TaxID=44745 RepID=A0A699ZSV1_HAELA|nr:hypothetical protein HaLaN_19208 [Haematococcus lacustris]
MEALASQLKVSGSH